jgi:hypothetical protein
MIPTVFGFQNDVSGVFKGIYPEKKMISIITIMMRITMKKFTQNRSVNCFIQVPYGNRPKYLRIQSRYRERSVQPGIQDR